MATLTPVTSSTAGATVTYAAASGGGDVIATTGFSNVKLLVKNASVSSITVTLTGVRTCSQGSLHDSVYTVAAGVEKAISLPTPCINATTGHVAVAYSAVTTVTVLAVAG